MIVKFIKGVPFLYSLALGIKHRRWNIQTKKGFKSYIDCIDIPKLQLGAGSNKLSGWFNTDYYARSSIFFLDATKKFIFPDGTFEYVFSEHHIEHISYKHTQVMLDEVFRVMKPGGYFKVNTPDLYKYISNYTNRTLYLPVIKNHVNDWIYSGFAKASTYIPADEHYEAHFINDLFLNYEHQFIYDEQALKTLLEKAGFVNISNLNMAKSCISELQNIESHCTDFDYLFTLSMQAQKPSN